jgi:hypothetical protein
VALPSPSLLSAAARHVDPTTVAAGSMAAPGGPPVGLLSPGKLRKLAKET